MVPINCHLKRSRVKYRDHSGQNIARLKLEVEPYANNHVQIIKMSVLKTFSVMIKVTI